MTFFRLLFLNVSGVGCPPSSSLILEFFSSWIATVDSLNLRRNSTRSGPHCLTMNTIASVGGGGDGGLGIRRRR